MDLLISSRSLALAAGLVAASSAFATTLGFDNLGSVNGAPFFSNYEQGYSVAAVSGDWFVAQVYGNPVPDIYAGPVFSVGPSAVDVYRPIGPPDFMFQSVDVSTNNGTSDYEIDGYLGGSLVYSATGLLNNIGFNFQTVTNPYASMTIDMMILTLTPDQNVTSMNVDNLVVTPEPATMAALALGAAAFLRRRKKA